MKPHCLLLLIFFFSFTALFAQPQGFQNGSLIITLISNDTVWIGADSRTSSLTEKGYKANSQGMCKIHRTNQFVYAMAGHVRYADNSFNFLEIMDRSAKQHTDFDSAVSLFQRSAVKEIRSILKRFSKKSIQAIVDQNNGAFLSVIVLAYVDSTRKMKEIKFSLQRGKGNIYDVVFKEALIGDVGTLRFVGHSANALQHIKENQFYFGNGLSIPQKIRSLISLEADASQAIVGLPADVVSVYNNGFKRVISSGLCQ